MIRDEPDEPLRGDDEDAEQARVVDDELVDIDPAVDAFWSLGMQGTAPVRAHDSKGAGADDGQQSNEPGQTQQGQEENVQEFSQNFHNKFHNNARRLEHRTCVPTPRNPGRW